MTIDNAQIAAQLTSYMNAQQSFLASFQAWANGVANGGPNGDGRYPINDGYGNLVLTPCLKSVQSIGASDTDAIYPDAFDINLSPSASWSKTYDCGAAIDAALSASLTSGKPMALRPGKEYHTSRKHLFDPSRQTLRGNGAKMIWDLKTFTDPASNPELLSDPGFDSGSPWIASTNCQQNNTATAPTYSNSDLVWTYPDGIYSYLEVGQQITAPAGTNLQITIIVDEITTRTYGANTYRDMLATLRAPVSGQSAAYSIGNGGNSGTFGSISNQNSAYLAAVAAGTSATFTFSVKTTVNNPFLRIQSNAQVRLASVSIKVIPDNTCMLIRVPPDGQLRGHNYHEIENLKVAGNPTGAAFVDMFEFDTAVSGFSSRAMMRNVDASDNIGRCAILGNRAYLNVFLNCRFVASQYAVDTLAGAADAGENIAFIGGNLGGGLASIRNRGGFTLHTTNLSMDFSRQWYTGTGGWIAVACWLELNSPTVTGFPLIDVQGGFCSLTKTRIQVDGSTSTALTAPFRVAANAILDVDADVPYNLHGTNGAICEGQGRFIFRGTGGADKQIDNISKDDSLHNIFGSAGTFENGSNILLNAWLTGVNAQQVDRYTVGFAAQNGSFTGNVTQGSNIITGLNTAATSVVLQALIKNPETEAGNKIIKTQNGSGFTATSKIGSNVLTAVSPAPTLTLAGSQYITGPGITGVAKIIAYDNGAGTITIDQYLQSANTGASYSQANTLILAKPWTGPTATGVALSLQLASQPLCSMSVSSDYGYNGSTKSLKLQKGQVGTSSVTAYMAFPVTANRGVGGRLRYKIPAQGTGTYKVYFQAFFYRLTEGGLVPVISDGQIITDQNSGDVDLSVGKDWSTISFGTGRVDASSQHDGYCPTGCTHVVMSVNIAQTPSGFVMYIDDLFGCMV